MQVVRGFSNVRSPFKSAVVSIGNFDGVHLGHQEILKRAKNKAKALGGEQVVYTFRPHPQIALRPEQAPSLLLTYDEKLRKLEALGVDVVVEEPFSREFSVTPAKDFFSEVLIKRLGTKELVVGYDFGFGKGREGNLDVLKRCALDASVGIEVVQAVPVNGKTVSSSAIRTALSNSQIEAANELLGASFFYRGIVLKGDHRGRKLGFNTANTRVENKMLLPYGVYGTSTYLIDDRGRIEKPVGQSISNFGVRPTFTAQNGQSELVPLLETHIFDFQGDIYGREIEVRFEKFVRTERKFSSVEELKKQIEIDVNSLKTKLA